MELVIRPTDVTTKFKDVSCRVWDGTGPGGAVVKVFVYMIAVQNEDVPGSINAAIEALPLREVHWREILS